MDKSRPNTQDSDEQGTLRRYLLGVVAEEARLAQSEEPPGEAEGEGESAPEARLAQIEARLLTDEGYFDALGAASDELIEQYLNDELTPDERERFERHFLCTPGRHKQLDFVRTLRAYNSRRRPDPEKAGLWARLRRWLSLPPVKVLAYALILLAVGFAGWRAFIYRSDVDEGLAALQETYRDRRPVEARVSSLEHAPLVVTRGGGGQEKNELARRRAGARLHEAVREDPGSADARRALGQFYLTERQFDSAVAEFREALNLSPRDARLHSDLGAALLEKAKESGPERADYLATLTEASASLDKSLSIDGSLRPALFNKALVLQSVPLPAQAKEAWRKYLQVDPDSPWAKEARHNLQKLEEP